MWLKAISGTLVKGLGEGSFFLSMQHYKNEIRKKLGFVPYPGTLNFKTAKKSIIMLKNVQPVRISGYKSNNKIFGGANCYKAKISNVKGSVIIPDLTKHKDIIEFIAPIHLKSRLKLSDGDKIKIEIIGKK
jgi:riboflavin kinase